MNQGLAGSIAVRLPPVLSGMLMGLPIAILVGCFFWLLTPDQETRKLCAAAAEAVLTSDDPLHVQRGMLVADGLNCNLKRSLRQHGTDRVLAALGQ